MSDTASRNTHTVPICTKGDLTATLTLPWFLSHAEYNILPSSCQVLVNGEDVFAAVHHAIAHAKRNICIICWGFQPSMYLVRNGSDLVKYPDIAVPAQLGKLLERKASEGVMVRVLCWAFRPGGMQISVTGFNESNTPGLWNVGMKDRPSFETDAQYAEDQRWFRSHNQDNRTALDASTDDARATRNHEPIWEVNERKNLHFRTRGFDATDRVAIGNQQYENQELSIKTTATLSSTPSHHQKMLLVDYDDPVSHVGFIMGNNLLDSYWDDNHHRAQHKPVPLQDFSTRFTGPIVGDMFYNFQFAWHKQCGETLPDPSFGNYRPRLDKRNPHAMVQMLRTQMQSKLKPQNIKRAYLQAVNNVTSFIYIENQYFRWPPLADKIKAAARAQKQAGRASPVYLFVITNSSDAGMGKGTVNTYRMLESLGRADAIPGVARVQRAIDAKALLGQAEQAERMATLRLQSTPPGSKAYQAAKAALEHASAQCRAAEQAYQAARALKEENITATELAETGLKTLVCTLVSADSPPDKWQEVYIHAKLMIVNDTYLTLGSANINTRSMQVDSELNYHTESGQYVTQPLRRKLWGMHTGNWPGANPERMDNFEVAYKTYQAWKKLLTENQKAESLQRKPIAPLHPFLRTDPARINLD